MQKIIKEFEFNGAIVEIIENSLGLINNTYVLRSCTDKFVLQKINTYVFNNPVQLMENIDLITNHINNLDKVTLEIIKNKQGGLLVESNGDFWRAFKFIKSQVYLKIDDPSLIFECAKCLANFHKNLLVFPFKQLNTVIPNFHNTSFIFDRFKEILLKTSEFEKIKCISQINYILSKENDCKIIHNLILKKKIPLRVCHNDPKISNILFDSKKKAICLIDLDTVMSGTILSDISDAIRTCCVSQSEEEKDLDKVFFKFDYFEVFIKSYLRVNYDSLNKVELSNLVFSVELIFLEQGIRFLSDYFNGNKYFKVRHQKHNLLRANNQLKLSKEIRNNRSKLQKILDNITHNF